jgi:hypothetical protein
MEFGVLEYAPVIAISKSEVSIASPVAIDPYTSNLSFLPSKVF